MAVERQVVNCHSIDNASFLLNFFDFAKAVCSYLCTFSTTLPTSVPPCAYRPRLISEHP